MRSEEALPIADAETATTSRWRTLSLAGELPLLGAWAAIGIGAAATDGGYSPSTIFLVTIGVLLLMAPVALRLVPGEHAATVGPLAVGAAIFTALAWPAGDYGSGWALHASHALTVAGALLVGLCWVLRLPRQRELAYLVVAVMAAAGVTMIISSPRPAIDVWYELQAAAHGLSHGHNIYTLRWTSGIAGEASNKFVYLPGSALLVWPFNAAFGDVRYGLLAAMVVTGVVLVAAGPVARRGIPLVAALFLVYPKAMFGLEQSWVDPLTLCALSLMGLAMSRGRRGWAVVAFAVALSCKQYNWLFIPFAAWWTDFGWRRTALAVGGAAAVILPFALADLHAFVAGAITYDLDLPVRLDSLSLHAAAVLHGGLVITLAATAVAVAIGLWRLPPTVFGFFLGCAAVIAVYNLFSRLSFYDEWELAGELALLAVVFGQAALGPGDPTTTPVLNQGVVVPGPRSHRSPALGPAAPRAIAARARAGGAGPGWPPAPSRRRSASHGGGT